MLQYMTCPPFSQKRYLCDSSLDIEKDNYFCFSELKVQLSRMSVLGLQPSISSFVFMRRIPALKQVLHGKLRSTAPGMYKNNFQQTIYSQRTKFVMKDNLEQSKQSRFVYYSFFKTIKRNVVSTCPHYKRASRM